MGPTSHGPCQQRTDGGEEEGQLVEAEDRNDLPGLSLERGAEGAADGSHGDGSGCGGHDGGHAHAPDGPTRAGAVDEGGGPTSDGLFGTLDLAGRSAVG